MTPLIVASQLPRRPSLSGDLHGVNDTVVPGSGGPHYLVPLLRCRRPVSTKENGKRQTGYRRLERLRSGIGPFSISGFPLPWMVANKNHARIPLGFPPCAHFRARGGS